MTLRYRPSIFPSSTVHSGSQSIFRVILQTKRIVEDRDPRTRAGWSHAPYQTKSKIKKSYQTLGAPHKIFEKLGPHGTWTNKNRKISGKVAPSGVLIPGRR